MAMSPATTITASAEDVDLLANGGFKAYRFSIAWPRVMPQGTGAVNAAGLDFYDRLVDRLLAKGVEPWACLYHWDLPQALDAAGGWHNRDIASWFTDYARAATARLGDRVKHWAMLNEPSVHAIFGHAYGNHAPGTDRLGELRQGAAPPEPRPGHGDPRAARRAQRPRSRHRAVAAAGASRDRAPGRRPRPPPASTPPGTAPISTRCSTAATRTCSSADFEPMVRAEDWATIRQKIDFLGVNYYGRAHIVADPNNVLAGAGFGPLPPNTPTTAMGWPVEPDGHGRDTGPAARPVRQSAGLHHRERRLL